MRTRNRILALLIISVFIAGCHSHFTNKDPGENEVIYADSLSAAPVASFNHWKMDDAVAIIDTDGSFHVHAICIDTAILMYEVISTSNRRANPEWINADQYHSPLLNNYKLIRTVQPAVKVRVGDGRLASITWLPASSVFPAPWNRSYEIVAGDTVCIRRFGDFPLTKGIVVTAAKNLQDNFSIQYPGYSGSSRVKVEDVFRQIRPIITADIIPGKIAYFENMYWVMILRAENNKILVREEGFPARDKWVPASTLQIAE